MKPYRLKYFFVLCLIITGFAWKSNQETEAYTIDKAVVWLNGSTSFDQWSMKSYDLQSQGAFSLIEGRLGVVRPFNFALPVKSLTSLNSARDQSVYKFLKAYPYDQIYFKHSYADIRSEGKNRFLLKVTGNITIAGVTQIMVLNLKCEAFPDSINMHGSTVLKMSKFHVVPKHLPDSATFDDHVKVIVALRLKPSLK